jgi:segregation and condensation protein B
MEMSNLKKEIATILFAYNDSIAINKIKEFLSNQDVEEKNILQAIEELKNFFNDIGLTIINSANSKEYILAIKDEMSNIVKHIRQDELEGELTPAALQVITICAYLGRATKNEISFIRGVQSSQSIRSLSARGLIKKEGEKYSLSIEAMQKLGVDDIKDLPEYEKINQDFTERLRDVLRDEKEE